MQDKIFKLIAEQLNIKPEDIKPNSEFIKDLKADSLDIVELVMNLEDHFNIQIPDEEAEKLVTVKDAIEYISALPESKTKSETSKKDDDAKTENK